MNSINTCLPRTLFQCIFNYVQDYGQNESRRLPAEESEPTEEATEAATDAPSQEGVVRVAETLNTLPDAIARLPARQRSVVVWRYYEGKSFDEMAEQLQVKPATVRSFLRQAITNLRAQYQSSDE